MTKLFIVLSIAAILFGVKALLDFQAFKHSPIRVTGEVVEILPAGIWMRLPQQARVMIRYTYEGRDFNVGNTAVSKRWLALKKGDSAELILNASNPSKFILADSLGDTSVLAPVLVAFGSILLVIGYFLRR